MSNVDEILISLRELVAEVCAVEPEEIVPEGELLGYGLDSILAVDLLLEIEQRWGIELPEHDPALRTVVTVSDLARLVDSRRAKL